MQKADRSDRKLGILPAVISPYVIAKIGETHARALFLTGERFEAERAMRIGLVHRTVDTIEQLDGAVHETVTQLRTSGPEAVRECKKLIAQIGSWGFFPRSSLPMSSPRSARPTRALSSSPANASKRSARCASASCIARSTRSSSSTAPSTRP